MKIKIQSLDQVLNVLRDRVNHDLGKYSSILEYCFDRVDPVFIKQPYGDFFLDCAASIPGWFADVILCGAIKESLSAEQTLELWQNTVIGKEIEDSLIVHARDEARHSHMYVKLVGIAFPDHPKSSLAETRKSLKRFTRGDLVKADVSISQPMLLDRLIQMNLAELRSLIYMKFWLTTSVTMCPKNDRERARDITDALLWEETGHVIHSAKLIDEFCRCEKNYKLARALYAERLQQFHDLTISQNAATVRAYGKDEKKAKYAVLLGT